MKQKQVERAIQEAREQKSMEVFNKHESELTPLERDELDDWLHPVWKEVTCRHGELVEVNQVGQVRDSVTKEPCKIINRTYNGGPGYPIAMALGPDGNMHMSNIHRLVAQAFIPNPYKKPEINHIDGHKNHNWVGNLEWVTSSENKQHAFRTGLNRPAYGEDNPVSKYTDDQIRYACKLLKTDPTMSYPEISERTDVGSGVIGELYKNNAWPHIVKEYLPFPARDSSPQGEDHFWATITNEQAEQVCQLLCDHPDWTFENIGNICNMSKDMVRHISEHHAWNRISSEHEFPKRLSHAKGVDHGMNKYDELTIRHTCEILNDLYFGKNKFSNVQIGELSGISPDMVSKIYRGKNWAHIAKDYEWYQAKFGNAEKDGSSYLDPLYADKVSTAHLKVLAQKVKERREKERNEHEQTG